MRKVGTTAAPTAVRTMEQATNMFQLEVFRVAGSGLSRVVHARLSNTGMLLATEIQVVVEVYAGGRRLKVSGQDSLCVDIGMLEAGTVVERSLELRFTLLEGLQLQASGAEVVATVHSDQGENVFRTRYTP